MTDEFLQVATKEINGDLLGLSSLLACCKNDDDVLQRVSDFQKYSHKIKGLAPMMGKESLGDVAKSLDFLLKKLIDGGKSDGIYRLMSEVVPFMETLMVEPKSDSEKVKQEISKIETLSN